MAKKRHHYVPESYLRNFTDPRGQTWCYSPQGGSPFPTNPKNAGCESHYHTFTRADGTKDTDTIEDDLCIIEGAAMEVIGKIVSKKNLTAAERETFIAFTSTMLVRVPKRRDQVGKIMENLTTHMMTTFAEHKEAYHADYRRFQEETGNTSDLDPEKIRQFILSGECELKANPKVALGMSFGALGDVMDCFLRMEWAFFHRQGRFTFITCDNPVFYCDPTIPPNSWRGVGLMNPGVEVSFPLSPNVAAFGSYHPFPQQHVTAIPDIVRRMNQQMVEAAGRYIFAHENNDALQRFIVQNDPTKPVRVL